MACIPRNLPRRTVLSKNKVSWTKVSVRLPSVGRQDRGIHRTRFHAAGRDIDEESDDLAVTDGLKVLTDCFYVPAGDKVSLRLQYVPAELDELEKTLTRVNPVEIHQDPLSLFGF